MNVMFTYAVLLLLAENPLVQSPFPEQVLQSWKRPAAEAAQPAVESSGEALGLGAAFLPEGQV